MGQGAGTLGLEAEVAGTVQGWGRVPNTSAFTTTARSVYARMVAAG